MNDWKACHPWCNPRKLQWCPLIDRLECPECGLAYTEDEKRRLYDRYEDCDGC